MTGWSEAHHDLAEALARFERTEAVLLFSSGFAANLGTIAAMAENEKGQDTKKPAGAVHDGGIDLKAKDMDLEVIGDGAGFRLPDNWTGADPARITGLSPSIVRVTVIPDMKAFLQ